MTVYVCAECRREYPVAPRQKDARVYDLALRHVMNMHHKVGPAAHAVITEKPAPGSEEEA